MSLWIFQNDSVQRRFCLSFWAKHVVLPIYIKRLGEKMFGVII